MKPIRAIRLPAELRYACLLVLCVWGLYGANVELEGYRQDAVDTGEVGPLPDGRIIRVASLGFERLVADLYWIRTVFYIGTEAAHDANYPSAEPLAHLVTDIDPQFDSAYVLLSSVLGGLRYDPEAAIRLLEKGTHHSDYWRIYFKLGFHLFMDMGEYRRAADYIREASERGGPPYLPMLASRLYTHGGEPESAIIFLQTRLRNETNERVRRDLQRRLHDVVINRDLGLIDAAIERYRQAHGETPESVDALVGAGLLKRMIDPSGEPYLIKEGKAHSTSDFEVLVLKQ